ncbi:hypothetical protein QQF64_033920 [Cirrhinus molitorella]|uniref:THAP-type domain-containing protein n=1 Tax=Cirrhinus molitorella TaxID=172907 RepID=A0ABR3MVA0_9TELE
MPSICCAVGCDNSKSQSKGLTFYNIPKNSERRQKWIAAIKKDHWTPTEHSRLCSEHFILGKKSDNPKNPDYVPSLFAYLSPEQRQRKINCYKKFEQTQAVKRKRCCSGDVSVSPHDYCTHMETDYSDNFPEDSRQNGNTATVKALPILSAVSYAPMKPAKQLLRN